MTGLWLMPIMASSDHDHGYAVANYRDITDRLALERELQSLLFKSTDAKEGIAANVEKRMATFKAE